MKTETIVKPSHTPTLVLPLQVIDNGAGVWYLCDSSNGVGAGREIAHLTNHADGIHNADLKIEDEINAALIVQCVNAHEKLITALRAISEAYASNGNTRRQKEAFVLVRQALSQAEGK